MDIARQRRTCDVFWTRAVYDKCLNNDDVPQCFTNKDIAQIIFGYLPWIENIEAWTLQANVESPLQQSHIQLLKQLNIAIHPQALIHLASSGRFHLFLCMLKCCHIATIPIAKLLHMFSYACGHNALDAMLYIHASNRFESAHFSEMVYLSIALQQSKCPAFVLWFMLVTNLLPYNSITHVYFVNECAIKGDTTCLLYILTHRELLQTKTHDALIQKGYHVACRQNNMTKAELIANHYPIVLRVSGKLTHEYSTTLCVLFLQPDTHVDMLVHLHNKCPFTSDEIYTYVCWSELKHANRQKQMQFIRDTKLLKRCDVLTYNFDIMEWKLQYTEQETCLRNFMMSWKMEETGKLFFLKANYITLTR